jgi:hypothetical protein
MATVGKRNCGKFRAVHHGDAPESSRRRPPVEDSTGKAVDCGDNLADSRDIMRLPGTAIVDGRAPGATIRKAVPPLLQASPDSRFNEVKWHRTATGQPLDPLRRRLERKA